MALPKLNANPNYEITIPSTGKNATYRPYLVKEEKVLLIAFESGNTKDAMRAIGNTLNACINEDIDVNKLTTFDVEYLFTQIRAKSVGETSKVLVTCKECEHKNEFELDITEVIVTTSDVDSIVSISDDITLELQYPTFKKITESEVNDKKKKTNSAVEDGFAMAKYAIKTIMTEDERFDASSSTDKELTEFIESMTTAQFTKISDYLRAIPQVQYDGLMECESCKDINEVKLRGLKDFL